MKLPEHKLKEVDYYEVKEGLNAGRNKRKDVVIVHWKDETVAEVPPLLDWIPGLQSLFIRDGGSERFEFKRRREVVEDKGSDDETWYRYIPSHNYKSLFEQLQKYFHD